MSANSQDPGESSKNQQLDIIDYLHQGKLYMSDKHLYEEFFISISNSGLYAAFRTISEITLYSIKNNIILLRVSFEALFKSEEFKNTIKNVTNKYVNPQIHKTVILDEGKVLIVLVNSSIIVLDTTFYVNQQYFKHGYPITQKVDEIRHTQYYKILNIEQINKINDIYLLNESKESITCLINNDNKLELCDLQLKRNQNATIESITVLAIRNTFSCQDCKIYQNDKFIAILNTQQYMLMIFQYKQNELQQIYKHDFGLDQSYNGLLKIIQNCHLLSLNINYQDQNQSDNFVIQVIIQFKYEIVLLEIYNGSRKQLNPNEAGSGTNIIPSTNTNYLFENPLFSCGQNHTIHIYDLENIILYIPSTMMSRYRQTPKINRELQNIQNISGQILSMSIYHQSVLLVVTSTMIMHLILNEQRQIIYQRIENIDTQQINDKQVKLYSIINVCNNDISMIFGFTHAKLSNQQIVSEENNAQQQPGQYMQYYVFKNHQEKQSVDHYFLGLRGISQNEKHIEEEDEFDDEPKRTQQDYRLVDMAKRNCNILNGVVNETVIEEFQNDLKNFDHFSYIQQLFEDNKKKIQQQATNNAIIQQQIQYYEDLMQPQITL